MAIKVKNINQESGYRQTEVGIIPEEWKAKSIGDLITFSGGSQPPRSTFRSQKKDGYIRLIQIRDYKTDEFETYIPEGLAQKKCAVSDIMIGRYGPPIFQILRGIEGAYNVALIKAIPSALIDREYLYQFLKQESLFHYIESLSQRSSGQTGIEMPALKNYPFPLPPLPEQQAIATALSDVDALITSLDKLIAKKRDIKQATMQQLLAKTWEICSLGDIVTKVGSGITPRGGEKVYKKDGRPFIRSQNVGWGHLLLDDIVFIDEETHYSFVTTEVKRDDVLLNITGASIGRSAVVSDRLIGGNVNQHVCIIRADRSKLSPYYLNVFLLSTNGQKQIESFQAGGNRQGLNFGQIKSFQIPIPSIPEQTAIATVLSDMDAEITALEQRRDKTRMLKQGMMQELLTGKTRLL